MSKNGTPTLDQIREDDARVDAVIAEARRLVRASESDRTRQVAAAERARAGLRRAQALIHRAARGTA